MNENVDAVLGKEVHYESHYNPGILVRIPRQDNRSQLAIDSTDLPFTGFDTWHAWEATFLVQGVPVNGVLKIIIPASSKYTVESKSLKLYLFGFAMESYDGDIKVKQAINIYETTIRKDLMKLLECNVEVRFHLSTYQAQPSSVPYYHQLSEIKDWDDLNKYCDPDQGTRAEIYKEDPSLLQDGLKEVVYFNLPHSYVYDGLRSNCRVTHQPDYGTVYISYQPSAKKSFMMQLQPASLAKYLISFRNENHFHEEIVETIYTRLWKLLQPEYLEVTAFYTRRGGIDICPSRCSSDANSFRQSLGNPNIVCKEFRS